MFFLVLEITFLEVGRHGEMSDLYFFFGIPCGLWMIPCHFCIHFGDSLSFQLHAEAFDASGDGSLTLSSNL